MSEGSRSAEDWIEEGIEYMQSEEFRKAIECFDKTIEIDPEYEKVWLHKGFCHGQLYSSDKAKECYLKAVEVDPNEYEAWYNMGNEHLNYGDPFIDDYWEDSGEYESAIWYYEKAVKANPEFSFAWNNMGFAHSKLGNHTKAAEYHEKAVELDPENESAWVNLGCEYYFLKKYEKAIETYEKAIEVAPGYDQAWITLRTSLDAYKNRIDLSHENKYWWVRIGTNYIKLDQLEMAIECFKEVIEIDHEYYEAWHELGNAYVILDDHQKFMECFEKPRKLLKKLKKVSIITTSKGPSIPDVFWLLESSSDIGIVPSEGPDENFLPKVQNLPNFNNEQVIKAMASTDDNIFVCWEN